MARSWASNTYATLTGILGISDWFTTTYDGKATLPDDAKDTGYSRAGQHLWLAADGSSAYLVSTDRVERWPHAKEFVGCI
jgi:hypothetical protein